MISKDKILRILLIVLWGGLAFPFFILIVIFGLISAGQIGYIPDFKELENPKSNLATEIFTSDKVLLGKYYKENRTIIKFEDLSPNVVNALIATEDARFYQHSGIDFRGLGRVLFKTVILRQNTGGGSTLSQQLAKNLYKMREQKTIKTKWDKAIMKFQEWVTAVLLEKNYTKEEILVMYLNTVTFGHNSYGIQTAAYKFFEKKPSELNLDEAAILVGLLKAPTRYSPKLYPERSLTRRNVVLEQLRKYQDKLADITGWTPLTDAQIDSVKNIPIKLSWNEQDHNIGLATYFREYLRLYITAKEPKLENYYDWNKDRYSIDSALWIDEPLYGWCNKNKKADGEKYDIYRDGLKIYTTLNSKMQKYAEDAMQRHLGTGDEPLQVTFEKELKNRTNPPFSWKLSDEEIENIMTTSMKRSERYNVMKSAGIKEDTILLSFKTPTQMRVFSWQGYKDTTMTPWDSMLYYKKFLQAGFISIEPQTGFIKAYVGGIDYNHFKFDHVMVAKRQVGSTIKPIVYSLAMEAYSPCYKVPNVPVTFEMPPGQYPSTYTPQYSSCKLDGQMISLKYGLALSLNQISAWVMKEFGPKAVVEVAKSMGIKTYLDPVYSLCVGSCDITLAEMVSAYTTFANKGVHINPVLVFKIEDKNGNIIANFSPSKNQAFDEKTAYKMVEIMRGVIDFGTSTRLRYKYGFAGDTDIAGKTGTTNDNSDGWFIGMVPSLVSGAWVGGEERSIRFSSTTYGQGAAAALPIWAFYMKAVLEDQTLGYSAKDDFQKPKKTEEDEEDEEDCKKADANLDENLYIINGENF